LLVRLVTSEWLELARDQLRRVHLAAIAATLIFALHPLTVEPVSAINFSSDLLVLFLTLLALLAATAFRPGEARAVMITGIIGTLCAVAAVMVKESGIAVAPILIVYWFLFRRHEAKGPWLAFLGSAGAASLAFLAARFLFAAPGVYHPGYLGGSLDQVFLIQPRLWVFMMGKLFCPLQLSADYTLQNVGISTGPAIALLLLVLALQIWLARKSRLGALGVAIFWLGLATVSNFVPLFCITADRYYYLPLAGVAMQLLALFAMTRRFRTGFRLAIAPVLLALVPLTILTFDRQKVFADDLALWSDTIRVSPTSPLAYNGLAEALLRQGEVDGAITEFRRALEIAPLFDRASNNLAVALLRQGHIDDAIAQWRQAIKINPKFGEAHSNLGNALLKKGQVDDAILEARQALDIDPYSASAHYNLGLDLMQKGDVDGAIAQYQRALEIDPSDAHVHNNLGVAFLQQRRSDDALLQFEQATALEPANAEAQQNEGTLLLEMGRADEAIAPLQKAAALNPANADLAYNFGLLFLQKGQTDDAIAQFRRALQLDPKRAEAHNNLAVALYQKGDLTGAIAEFEAVVQLKPGDAKAQANLAKAQALARPANVPK
jgi:tetratricopeptide (TPR) repeat protein